MKTIVQLVSKLKEYLIEKDTAAKKAVESNIAPVEADASSASRAYSVRKQLILNDILYDVTATISIGDALIVGSNILAAGDLTTQVEEVKSTAESKQDQIVVTSMPTASASNVGKVLIYIGSSTSDYTSGHSYQSTLESGSYVWRDVSGGSTSADNVSYDGTSSGLTASNVQNAIDELQDEKQDQIEVTSMPTASASNVGKVLIYIGSTTSNYTSGHSYQSTLESGSYVWKDVSGGATSADDVSYDGTSSGLTASNVQNAIDELNNKIGTITVAIIAADATTVTFEVPTSGNNLIEFWISDGSNYTSIDTSVSGYVTLTYEAASSSRDVSMCITEF